MTQAQIDRPRLEDSGAQGPLVGLRVVEMGALGPAPFCAMVLADMGAEVVRIERPGATRAFGVHSVTARGRPILELDMRQASSVETVLGMLDSADVLIEGFRPGVMERLGLGSDICLARQPRLVYARMTGWGQDGPLAKAAGHDINYLALTGALHAIGEAQRPVPPLNLVADFGGGGMVLAFGILAAIVERARSGRGQVVDGSMVDGAALLSTMHFGMHAAGRSNMKRGKNMLDGGAHFYRTYACGDDKFIAIGAIEPQFYSLLLDLSGIEDAELRGRQNDAAAWPELAARLEQVFRQRTQAQWCELLEGTDACFAPVLDWSEAPRHPHNQARGTFVTLDGVVQPGPAPRFSRTPGRARSRPESSAQDILHAWHGGASASANEPTITRGEAHV